MKPRQGYEDDIKGLTRISVKAVPDEGYVFIGWNDGGTDNPRIIEKLNIRNNKLTANFEWQQTPPVEQETNEEPDVVAKNTMVYNNETIKLADNINPNCFCWKSDATGEMIKTANPSKMTLKQINGELLDIPWSDANKITSRNVTYWDKNVETLNDNFLWFCKNLKEINLDFLSKIKKIGHNFLCYCESLKQIDLSKLTLLESIGDNFLYGEQSLNNLTISGFTSLKTIGESFLAKCHNVYKLDLGSLFKVETIGNNFLWEAHLSTIDMSKMSSLKYIGDSFLRDCSRLDKLYLPIPKGTDSVPELKSLGDGPKWNYVTIYCGSWLDKYQKADVWSTRASQMVDGTKQKQESN